MNQHFFDTQKAFIKALVAKHLDHLSNAQKETCFCFLPPKLQTEYIAELTSKEKERHLHVYFFDLHTHVDVLINSCWHEWIPSLQKEKKEDSLGDKINQLFNFLSPLQFAIGLENVNEASSLAYAFQYMSSMQKEILMNRQTPEKFTEMMHLLVPGKVVTLSQVAPLLSQATKEQAEHYRNSIEAIMF